MASTVTDQNGGSSSSSPTTVLNTGLSTSAAVKAPCKVAAASAITLSGEQTIDGVAIVTDDRVLVTAQASSVANGIYIASTGAWSRSQDFNRNDDVKEGTSIRVTDGTSYSGLWVVTAADPITIDTTAITFSRDTALTNGVLLAANNLSDLASAIAGWDALARYTGTVTPVAGVLDFTSVTAPFAALAAGAITSVTLGSAKFRIAVVGAAPVTITPSATLFVNGGVPNSQVFNVPLGSLVIFMGGNSSLVRVFVLGMGEWSKGADILSAATVTLTPNAIHHITSTTTITDVDFSPAVDGASAWVVFDGALTLTHNSTTLKLPGGANITTAANDRALFFQDATDNVICLAYVKANGLPTVTVTPAAGGTGLTTLTANNVILGNGTSSVQFVAPSTSGNVLTSNGTTWQSTAPASGGPTLGTMQESTSGSSINFTSIPATAKVIIVSLAGVSTNGTGALTMEVGDSGGLETAGYVGAQGSNAWSAAAILLNTLTAAHTYSGQIVLTLMDAATFTWSIAVNLSSNTSGTNPASGYKALSAALDRLSIKTADTFDAGNINIAYY